jgi:hypothetical protein
MQYSLLLALLLRQRNGSATFSQKDLAHTDTDYNILFARTLDGKSLEVTVVSSESGIIRSPAKEREAEKWRREQEEIGMMTAAFQQLPPPSTPSSTTFTGGPSGPQDLFSKLHEIGWNPGGGPPRATDNSPVQYQPGANQSGFAIPQGPAPAQTAEVIPMPNPGPATPTDGSTSYHFPFQVGSNPLEAKGPESLMNLDRVHQQLLAKDQEVLNEEREAIARQERGE